jgi:type II secretory ATPase GspE/PulE/Tfp pilus assembly ATPase PilB-like protein
MIATLLTNASPVVRNLVQQSASASESFDTLVRYAAHQGAGDLYLSAQKHGYTITIRHDGMLRELGRVSMDWGTRVIGYAKVEARLDPAEHRKPQDGRILVLDGDEPVDVRVSTMRTFFGEDLALRILDRRNQIFDVERLGLPPRMKGVLWSLIRQPHGLVLVTGSTGSGKTTTLYSILSALNDGTAKINTLEDPIEFDLPGVHQSQVFPRIGLDFGDMLPAVLRQDPDIIMVGEVRDTQTATTAVRAAATGQLVFATLHSTSASGAIHSMLGLGAHPHLAAATLRGVIAQHLVRRICTSCVETLEGTVGLDMFTEIAHLLPAGAKPVLHQGRGCGTCNHTGYKGRSGIFEMLVCNTAIRELVQKVSTPDAIEAQSIAQGMIPLRHSAKLMVAEGLTTIEEVMRILDMQA